MKSGYLWFDNTPGRAFPEKVERMIVYYRQKTGREFDLCCVHPDTPGLTASASGVEIRTSKTVLPNHFWLGRRDE